MAEPTDSKFLHPASHSEALDPSTLAVTLGRQGEPGAGVNPPIELSSTFRAGGPVLYGREGNASWDAFEEVLGGLEGGRALAFASGMAAIAAVMETLPTGAAVVAPGGGYGGMRRFLADLATRGRLSARLVDVADTKSTLDACRGAGLLWLESPTNPGLGVADLAALCEGAHGLGVPVAVDNTFATPLLQRPLALGADVVVHSASKLLGGHSDLVLGAAISRDPKWLEQLQRRRTLHGAIAGPFEAWLALRGLRTLPVRLARAQASAAELAHRLLAHPSVASVRYPGLEQHPGHELAARQMRGFGSMVSFEVQRGAEVAEGVCTRVRLLVHATSLGGVETLIERRGRWLGEEAVPPGLLRMSVGLEDVDDLWADLDQALQSSSG